MNLLEWLPLWPPGDELTGRQSGGATEPAALPAKALDAASVGAEPAWLQTLNAHPGPVLVDLDHSLYLRHVTDEFLDTARPGFAAALLLSLLERLQPWRGTGGAVMRDLWRVRVITLFLPWTLMLWRRRVGSLAHRHLNRPLLAALLERREPPVIVTAAPRNVALPLVSAIGLDGIPLVCPRGARDTRVGLVRLCEEAIGPETLKKAFVITASAQNPLPKGSAQALWRQRRPARPPAPLARAYWPGRYLTEVKWHGERSLGRGILQEDFAFWMLASIGFAAVPALHVAGLLLLLVSFWAVYEQGYVDHDRIDPRRSQTLERGSVYGRYLRSRKKTPVQPWLWAATCGGLGILLLHAPLEAPEPMLRDALKWAAVLLAAYSWFLLFNRHRESTRLWLYPGLQLFRVAGFAALVTIGPIGAVALGAHVLSEWFAYSRHPLKLGTDGEAPVQLLRLVIFAMGAGLLALALGPMVLLTPPALALAAWNLYRARHELHDAWRTARSVDREDV